MKELIGENSAGIAEALQVSNDTTEPLQEEGAKQNEQIVIKESGVNEQGSDSGSESGVSILTRELQRIGRENQPEKSDGAPDEGESRVRVIESLEKRLSALEKEIEAKAIDNVREKIGRIAGVENPDELIREFAQDNREDEEFLKFVAGTPERFVKSVVNHYKLKRGSRQGEIAGKQVSRSTLVNDLLKYIE